MCDPVTLGLAIAASAGGSYLNYSNSLSNANAEAAAENGVLQQTVGGLNNIYNKTNAPAFNKAISGYGGDNGLAGDQAARTNTILGNLPAPTTGGTPLTMGGDSAPGAVGKAYAGRLSDAFNFNQRGGAALGNLGGYSDQWVNNGLNAADAARTIGVGNAQANNLKGLLAPEQKLASIEAYKNPSLAGTALTGLGSIFGSISGAGGIKAIANKMFPPTPVDPNAAATDAFNNYNPGDY